MSKVKIIKSEIKEVETNLEYPIYLYFQYEDCHDEYIMVNSNNFVKVKEYYFGFTIEYGTLFNIEEHWLKNNLTEKDFFDECLKEAIEFIKSVV